jgi:hypothetical protein
MIEFLLVVVGLALAATIFGVIASFLAFDKIIRAIYKNDRGAWKKFGCPIGFFWAPPERRKHYWVSGFSRSEAFQTFLRSDHSILPAETDLLRKLHFFYRLSAISSAIFAACLLLTISWTLLQGLGIS